MIIIGAPSWQRAAEEGAVLVFGQFGFQSRGCAHRGEGLEQPRSRKFHPGKLFTYLFLTRTPDLTGPKPTLAPGSPALPLLPRQSARQAPGGTAPPRLQLPARTAAPRGNPTLALAARCMPGAVVPAAFRGPRAARRPLLTGAGHHQQAEGRRPPPAPPPRQERHGDEQEGEEQQDGGGAAQRGKRRLHGATAGGASRPTAAGAAQNSALGGRAGPGTASNGRARPLSLSYTLSYTLRNTRAIPIHLLQFYTLP